MDKQRLHQLVDLVLDTEYWGTKNRACIFVDGYGDNWVNIHTDIGTGAKSVTYYSDIEREGTYPDGDILDPNFDAAETRIRQLLLEIKVDEDDT